jgi:phage-related protein
MSREIILYSTKDGKCPVRDFLDSLPEKVFQKTSWVLQLLVDLDKIPSVYFKKLANTDDIWECRISSGSNIYRIFCFFHKGYIVVLTHGIVKKSQKTLQREITRAEEYKKDYLRRMK